jgi:tetratricopeptide (TPR) repeat protein
MFELKKLHKEAIPAALEKANRYRLLNEPGAAESIYLDVLAIDPDNQDALKNIILAMSDRFGKDYAIGDARVSEYIMRLKDDYQRNYYTGIMYERRGKATLAKDGVGAYELFRQAMECFEKAESMKPAGNDECILRWNGCVRIITANNLEPRDMGRDFLE